MQILIFYYKNKLLKIFYLEKYMYYTYWYKNHYKKLAVEKMSQPNSNSKSGSSS